MAGEEGGTGKILLLFYIIGGAGGSELSAFAYRVAMRSRKKEELLQ